MRPHQLHVGGVLYWVMLTRDPDTMLLKDADATPTVAVRKNGASTGDSVTITKRSATTGIYDCSYNPAGEVEGDSFTLEERAQVTGTTTGQEYYNSSFEVRVLAVERGTDGANTIAPLTSLGATAPPGWIDASAIATDAIGANEISAAGVTKIQSGLATAAQVSSLQVNTRTNIQVPIEIETPDASTQIWKIRMFLFDEEGNMEAPDSTPTITLTNAAGTNRAARLSAATVIGTGAYSWDYTATAGDAEEQLVWQFTVLEGGFTRIYPATSYVVEETAYRFSSTDRATLNATATATALAAVSTKLGTPVGASLSVDIAAVKSETATLVSRVTSTVATMWGALVEMIVGTTPNRQFSAKALELGQSSGALTNEQATQLASTWKHGEIIEFNDADAGQTETHRIITTKIS